MMTNEECIKLEELNDQLRPLVFQGALQVFELMHRGLIKDYRQLTSIIRVEVDNKSRNGKYSGSADDQSLWEMLVILMCEFLGEAETHELYDGMDPWSEAAKELFEWEAFPEQIVSLIKSIKGDT